ncbi:conserved hypothetical protein [Paraburkholderia sacchari]|uniref:hypothetical protein n=1 Tax=Paraburkholderia sacchari TaxID=159450 RepID=UPI0039A5BAE4
MSLPEGGRSYNALSVPLTSDWQCSLVPARDADEPTTWWSLPYDERQKKRKEREEQIEHDRVDFDRLFRVSTSRRAARACSDFSAYTAFIRDHLGIVGVSAPVDGEGVTRILREAVRDGRLVPAIDRAWRGSRRVGRSYAPQSWPKRTPDPKPTVYGVRDGQFVPLNDNGYFIDLTPYVPVAARVAATASSAASSGGGTDWLGVVEEAVGALLGGDSGSDDNSDGAPGMANSLTSGDDSTPLGDAQPFEYSADIRGGDGEQIAGMPFNGEPGTWISSMPGTMPQMRQYGANGTPLTDFDLEAHHGNPNPHAHNWDGYNRDEGAPVSLLPW